MDQKVILIGKRFDYSIVIKDHYIGGYLQAKKPRKGETWLRGNDLHDGPHTVETWLELIRDIIGCEVGTKYKSEIK